MNLPNSSYYLLAIALLFTACTDSDEPNSVYQRTDLPFTIQKVGLGSTEQELLENLGDPISRSKQPPQFGELETGYDYHGLYIHVTDGVIFVFSLTDGPFRYDNGIAIGMTKAEASQILGMSFTVEYVCLELGVSDCFVNLEFTKDKLTKVFQAC